MKQYWTILGYPVKYQAIFGCIIQYFDVPYIHGKVIIIGNNFTSFLG